jgi:hypothetical protein
MKNGKRQATSLEEIRRLLESGVLYKNISALTGWHKGELSLMAKCWNIPRQRGTFKRTAKSDGK